MDGVIVCVDSTDPGVLEHHNRGYDFHDIDMAPESTGFAVGDDFSYVVGRKYQRFDPADFGFETLYDSCYEVMGDPRADVILKWYTLFENHTKEWGFQQYQHPFIWELQMTPMFDAQGESSDSVGYVYHKVGVPIDKNSSVFYTIVLTDTHDPRNWQYYGPYELYIDCFESTATVPDTCTNFVVEDNPDDQGGILKLTWSPPEDPTGLIGYKVGRSLDPDGPFFLRQNYQGGTTYYDSTAVTGIPFYYKVASIGDLTSSVTAPHSGISLDNTPPDPVDSLWIAWQRRYAGGDSILICIEWTKDTQDSTLAGYWVCPQQPPQMLRAITGVAPIRRNWYMFAANWETEKTVIVGVLPMDYSDGMPTGDSAWTDIPIHVAAHQTSLYDATGDNNGNRIAQTTNGDLHIGFASQERDTDFVYYQVSTDGGKHWASPTEVDPGRDPCLDLDANGTPYMVWRKIESNGSDLIGKLYFSKKGQQGWSTPYEIYSTTAPFFSLGPPAVATDDTGTANIVWKAREHLTGNTYADIVFAGYFSSSVASPQLNYEPIDTVWEGTPTAAPAAMSPSIDLDLADLPHVVWAKSGDIYYRAKGPLGWPGDGPNISKTVELDSRKPHIDLQGDLVRVVWEEEHSQSAGYYDVAVWSNWNDADSKTAEKSTLSSNCLDPVVDRDFILWSEKVGDHYEVFLSRYDWQNYEWGDSLNISDYPYADSRYPQVLAPTPGCGEKPRIYCYWTEGPNPYWTRFQMREFSNPDEQSYYALDLGLETPSPVTVNRDGYISYGAPSLKTVDYDTDTLRYECNMDSTYTYTLRLSYYHEGGTGRSFELLIDGTPVDTSTVPSEQKVTIEEVVDAGDVQDGQITAEVRSISGDTATCGEFLLFQCVEGGGGGGGQAAMRRTYVPTRPMLMAPYPNPSTREPVFQYFLPQRSQAVLRVFDVTGRLVETIVNDTQKPGWHRAGWKAANQASGVYFCRLNAGETCITRKFILLH